MTLKGKSIIIFITKNDVVIRKDDVMDIAMLKGLRRNLLLLALLELVCGLFMIIMNHNTIEIIIVAMGAIAASYGIVNFFAWLIKREKESATSAVVILVLGILSGVMIVVFRKEIEPFFRLVAGAISAIFGLIKLPNMAKIKKGGFDKWWVILIFILAITGIGIFIGLNAFNEGFSRNTASVLLGVSLVLGCAADIFAMAGTSDIQKQLLNGEVEAEIDTKEGK